jgi:hypothetical protein
MLLVSLRHNLYKKNRFGKLRMWGQFPTAYACTKWQLKMNVSDRTVKVRKQPKKSLTVMSTK